VGRIEYHALYTTPCRRLVERKEKGHGVAAGRCLIPDLQQDQRQAGGEEGGEAQGLREAIQRAGARAQPETREAHAGATDGVEPEHRAGRGDHGAAPPTAAATTTTTSSLRRRFWRATEEQQ